MQKSKSRAKKIESQEVIKVKGYKVKLDEIIQAFVANMYFDGDESKRPNPETAEYYIDPMKGVVIFNLDIPKQNS